MSDDIDAPSDLLGRVADLEADLVRIRHGKEPPSHVDLLGWRAQQPPEKDEPAKWLRNFARSLREDWKGLNETLMGWATRVEKRFARR